MSRGGSGVIKVRSQLWFKTSFYLSDTLSDPILTQRWKTVKINHLENQFLHLNHDNLNRKIFNNLQDFFHWHCVVAIFPIIHYLPHICYKLFQMEKDSRSITLSKGTLHTMYLTYLDYFTKIISMTNMNIRKNIICAW